jgi:hypothetical protein
VFGEEIEEPFRDLGVPTGMGDEEVVALFVVRHESSLGEPWRLKPTMT